MVDPLVMLDMVVQVVEMKEMLVLMEKEQDWVDLKLQVVREKDPLVLDLSYKVVMVLMLVQVVVDIMVEVVEIHRELFQMVQVVEDQDILVV